MSCAALIKHTLKFVGYAQLSAVQSSAGTGSRRETDMKIFKYI